MRSVSYGVGAGSAAGVLRARWQRILTRSAIEARGKWWVYAAPLLLYVFIGGTDGLLLGQFLSGQLFSADIRWDPASEADATAKYAAALAVQKYQAVAYLGVLALLIGRVRALVAFLRAERWLVLVFVALALTALSSDVPFRVFANMVHLTFGFLAIWVYLHDSRPRGDLAWSVSMVVALPISFVVAASLLAFVVNPGGGLEFLLADQRYGGIAGGPNALGGISLLGTVAAVGLFMAPTSGRRTRMFALVLLGMTVCAVITTGSATATVVVALGVLTVPLRAVYRRASARGRIGIIMLGAAAVVVLPIVAVVQQNVEAVAASATGALGKDIGLTGRVDIWITALHAFEERPVLGWGYDNHETVLADPLYTIPYVQYHNGYLDNLVVGGALLGAAILCCYVAFVGRALRATVRGADVYLFVIAFSLAALHNLTEYSLFRAGSSVFTLWLLAYVALQVRIVRPAPAKQRRAVKRRNPARSRKRISWG